MRIFWGAVGCGIALIVIAIYKLVKEIREEQQKRYCEYCGQHKKDVILWIKGQYIHKICEDCLKEGVLNDKKDA